MKYSIVFKLKGAIAEVVAVEWTDRAEPKGSGDGWEPCVRLKNGDWRIFSYGATDGRAAHWRDPGLFDNIGLRYRLAPAAAPLSTKAPMAPSASAGASGVQSAAASAAGATATMVIALRPSETADQGPAAARR